MKICNVRRAIKEHKCDYGQDTILPGETYFEDVYPPWTLTSDDPEGPPFPLGEWYRERYHVRCYYEGF